MTEEVSCKGMQDNNYTKIERKKIKGRSDEPPICDWTPSMSAIIKIMYKRKNR